MSNQKLTIGDIVKGNIRGKVNFRGKTYVDGKYVETSEIQDEIDFVDHFAERLLSPTEPSDCSTQLEPKSSNETGTYANMAPVKMSEVHGSIWSNEGYVSYVEDVEGDIRFGSDVTILQRDNFNSASTSNYKNVTPISYEALIRDNEIHQFEKMVKKSFYEKNGKEHQRSYAFGDGEHKLIILDDTLNDFLKGGGRLREVDVSLPERELPNFSGKSREQILDILESCVSEDHEQLVEALEHNGVEHTVTGFTKNIFVKDCDWKTLFKIGKLVDQLQCDLTISGGGPCEYSMDSPSQDLDSGEAIWNTEKYQRKFTQNCNIKREPSSKIGVIDSGCSLSLYNELHASSRLIMHEKMIDCADAKNVMEVEYEDCYVQNFDGVPYTGHGTGVVEVVSNCALPRTKIYVANIGSRFDGGNVDSAMKKLCCLGVNVMNCSFTVGSNSINLKRTLRVLKCTGVVVVASAGNIQPHVQLTNNTLNDESTIIVGSHNILNLISSFSVGGCRVSICSLGERVYIKHISPQLRDGTSFAAPHVTAAVANFLSQANIPPNEVKYCLQTSAAPLNCPCKGVDYHPVNLKLDPERLMGSCTAVLTPEPDTGNAFANAGSVSFAMKVSGDITNITSYRGLQAVLHNEG